MQSPFKQPRPGSDAKEGNARLCLMLIVCVGVIELGHNYMFFSRTGSKYMPLQLAPELLSRPGISRSDVGGYDHIGGLASVQTPATEVYLSQGDPLLSQIPTILQLRRDFKVFVIQPDDWIAAQPAESGLYYYIMDGLREHPRIHLVPRLEEADLILHLVLHTNITADSRFLDPNNEVFKRLVIIDENDHFFNSFHRMFNDYGFLAFFKRSYVQKRSGDPVGIDRESGSRDLSYSHWPMRHNYLPFAYGVARRYMAGLWGEQGLMAYDDGEERDIPVVCTLREYHKPAWPGGRENVSAWLTEMAIEGAVLGEVSDWQEGNRHQNNGPYLDAMRRAQIVVTSNPGDWEGDFRLWEAMATKALVFVDYMYMPVPHFFQDGVDAIFFDVHDKQAFMDKVSYYLEHPKEARKIAMSGYYKALRYHRYVNRVDYVFNTVDHLLDDAYRETGMAMKERAMRSEKHIFREHTAKSDAP